MKKTPGAILRGRMALGGTLTNNLGFWIVQECFFVDKRVCIGSVKLRGWVIMRVRKARMRCKLEESEGQP
jgi:hypothetical protein